VQFAGVWQGAFNTMNEVRIGNNVTYLNTLGNVVIPPVSIARDRNTVCDRSRTR
jgi:hypothetical protein